LAGSLAITGGSEKTPSHTDDKFDQLAEKEGRAARLECTAAVVIALMSATADEETAENGCYDKKTDIPHDALHRGNAQ
jgi:hypothetical protein